MEDYFYLGYFTTTHGIKGELKLKSPFAFCDEVIKPNTNLYIGKSKIKEKIKTVRLHKGFYLVLFENYNNINEVLKYIGKEVYLKKDDLPTKEKLKEKILGFKVLYNNQDLGIVTSFLNRGLENELIEIDHKILIPFIDNFVKKIDLNNEVLLVDKIEGLI